ncbi:MAG: LAGLIDADG family homing endonuclease [Nitrososphaerota archaeon]
MNIMSEVKQRGEEYYEIMQKIYEEAIKLHKENNFGGRRISKIIEEKYGIKLHWTIKGWIYKGKHPLGNSKKVKLCRELAYVIGAWLGDGTLAYYRRRSNYLIKLKVKDYDFAKEYGRCAGIANGNPVPYRPIREKHDGKYSVKFCNVQLFYLLKKSKENPWILMPYIKLFPAEVCRGFFDSEGSPSFNGKYCFVIARNDNLELLKMIAELLKSLGMSTKIYTTKITSKTKIIKGIIARRNVDKTYILYIQKKEGTIKFYKLIGFEIKRKQEKLRQALLALGWI